ncbi:MAG: YlzJ-like family protein [Ruminiclostridium sp.]|nr:YlzJ-like family protein [Ruminiclostridium sp.]
MLYTIIDQYDIFFPSEMPEFSEKRTRNGIAISIKNDGKLQPYSFFSTDPKAYLDPENKVNSLYYN